MKTFIEDLKKELNKLKLSDTEKQDIINDYKEMIETALEEGLDPNDIEKKFGSPKRVAEAIASDQGISFKDEEEKPKSNRFSLWKSYTPTQNSMKLVIKLIHENVLISTSKDDKIHVYQKGEFSADCYELSFSSSEMKLVSPPLKGFKFKDFFQSHNRVEFLIEIPEELVLENVQFTMVNGNSSISNIKADAFQLSTTNGDVEIKDSYIGNFKINTVNGDIESTKLYVDFLKATTVSGDIRFQSCVFNKEIKLNTVSGDFEINESTCYELEMTSVSGDLKGKEFYPKKINFKSVSGDIELKNKDRQPIEINKKSPFTGSVTIEV